MKGPTKLLLSMSAVALLCVSVGCDKKGGDDSAAGSAEKIGVAACDDYIEKYGACIQEKAPEASKAAMETSFKQMADSWRQAAASGPDAKAALETGCKAALDGAKQASQAWGCSW